MSAAPLIRPMVPADLDDVLDLEPVLFGTGAWNRATYETELAIPGRRYVVVERAGELGGYAGIDLAEQATIMTVGVAPAHRRRGLGRALTQALLDQAEAAGCAEVHLEVRADDPGAQALYASLGFGPVGRRRGYYQGTDALTMRLRLRGPGPMGSERRQT
ncbi:ribosomal protein S18-alanine N-acetyltransferase [Pseudactinotalea sp. Z1732]|uniref:ribosomal protein S18-alanine N-acetyltransferase n=1 Tax=Micrococcales TaxID=85006 RepID=UPI003C7E9891